MKKKYAAVAAITFVLTMIAVTITAITVAALRNAGDDKSGTQDGPVETLDVLYDKHGYPLQKTARDNITGYTYIYTFEYSNGLNVTCDKASVIILDADGNVIA